MTFPPTGTLHLTMIFPRWEWEDCKSIAELLVTITKRATLGSIFEVMFKSQLTTVDPNVPSIGRWLFLASSYGLVITQMRWISLWFNGQDLYCSPHVEMQVWASLYFDQPGFSCEKTGWISLILSVFTHYSFL